MKNIQLIFLLLIKSIINSILNCNHCGNKVASTESYIDQQSIEALNKNHQSNFQLFKSKYGKYFTILTLSHTNLLCQNSMFIKDSFFPGYMWSICICPICNNHLGWMFYPDNTKCSLKQNEYKRRKCEARSLFYGVIMDQVRNQSFNFSEKIDL